MLFRTGLPHVPASGCRYVVVTPVRDEERYLPFTVESVVQQTIQPVEYVLVNDGSRDSTGAIIDEFASRYPWIRAVHRQDRGFRKTGGGIIEAFYAGFDALQCRDWDFVAKLDGDLSFDSRYFENCFENFHRDPRLGIGGGYLYFLRRGKSIVEECPEFHVRGGTKIYRRACWNDIGHLWVGPSSDTVDEIKAQMAGWRSRSFRDLMVRHHRPTGQEYGVWGAASKDGRGDYVCGYHPLFMFAKCAYRILKKPYVIGSMGLLWGFLGGYARRTRRVDDADVIRFVRQQQMNKLLGRESIWR